MNLVNAYKPKGLFAKDYRIDRIVYYQYRSSLNYDAIYESMNECGMLKGTFKVALVDSFNHNLELRHFTFSYLDFVRKMKYVRTMINHGIGFAHEDWEKIAISFYSDRTQLIFLCSNSKNNRYVLIRRAALGARVNR